jgi:intein-encoded DNA endonuclease-like protein
MARPSTFDAWNLALDGQLAQILAGYRHEGTSFEDIAQELYAKRQVKLSRDTVRRFCERADVLELINREPAA